MTGYIVQTRGEYLQRGGRWTRQLEQATHFTSKIAAIGQGLKYKEERGTVYIFPHNVEMTEHA